MMNGTLLIKLVTAISVMSACVIVVSSCSAAANGTRMNPDPEVGTMQQDCDGCPLMIVVPAGSFTMGSPPSEQGRWEDEGPQHRVTIDESFWVGVYEVSYAEWNACVAAGGCTHRPNDYGVLTTDHPVIDVSWNDATEYVAWLSRETDRSYRLLSEAEWEYVARAGTNTARYWGQSSSHQCLYANGADESTFQFYLEPSWEIAACDDRIVDVAPVGAYRENGFGVHDVLGNVWELTEDCWHESYEGAPTDGSAWIGSGYCGVAVVRGGGWVDGPSWIRSAIRAWIEADLRSIEVGFRVARSLSTDDRGSRSMGGGSPSGEGGGGKGGDNSAPSGPGAGVALH